MSTKSKINNSNLKQNAIIQKLEKINLAISKQDKKISALKDALKEREKSEKNIINKVLTNIDRIDEIRIYCERTNKIEVLDSINTLINNLKNDLREIGVEEIPGVGEVFNTNIHECIETKKVDSKEKGIVLEVVRRGYYFEGKVMRAALVITTQ